MLFGCRVDASLGDDEQPGDEHHRPTDQQRFVPPALVGEHCVCEMTHTMDRTGVAD